MQARIQGRSVSSLFSVFVVLAGCLVVGANASAGTISANFIGGASGTNIGTNSAGVVPATGWNDITGGSQTNYVLLNESGANSGVTLTYSGLSSGAGNATTFTAGSGNFNLLRGNIFRQTNPADLILGGIIPYDVFDLYVYYNGAVGANDSQNFTIVQAALTKLAVDGALINENSFIESNGTNEGNYVRFAGLTKAALPNFTLRAQGVVGIHGYFNGFQIVDSTPIPAPEPASLVLLGMGSLLVVQRSRRNLRSA